MELSLTSVRKGFGPKLVLRDVSFRAESGRAFGLLGRNGAGKTTTIRILMNVFPADGGDVLLDGRPIDYSAVGIGYLPEERGLYPKKRVIDQLVYFARLKGMTRQAAEKSVDRWLDRLGMKDARAKRLDTLSKGNQQKIQLITALAHDPRIVILDEPFSGLDPVNALLLKDVVREQLARDRIVLFSSHQMNTVEEFCDSIAILNGGKIVLDGDLRSIRHSYVRDRLVVRSPEAKTILQEFSKPCTLMSDGSLMVRLAYAGEKNEVMRKLTYQYEVDEIRVFEPSLGDIFVEYAAGGKTEGAYETV